MCTISVVQTALMLCHLCVHEILINTIDTWRAEITGHNHLVTRYTTRPDVLLHVSYLIYDAYVSFHTSPWRHERKLCCCPATLDRLRSIEWHRNGLMVWFRRFMSGLCKQGLVWCTFPYSAPELHLLSSSDWSVCHLCTLRLKVTYTHRESKCVRKEESLTDRCIFMWQMMEPFTHLLSPKYCTEHPWSSRTETRRRNLQTEKVWSEQKRNDE